MDTKGARTNRALKLAPEDFSPISLIEFPKSDPAKKQYNSELEIYTHFLNSGNFIGIYVHSLGIRIDNALYAAEKEASHTFAVPVERLNELVESALVGAGLDKLLSRETVSEIDMATLGVYSYLISQEHEDEIREALNQYWV